MEIFQSKLLWQSIIVILYLVWRLIQRQSENNKSITLHYDFCSKFSSWKTTVDLFTLNVFICFESFANEIPFVQPISFALDGASWCSLACMQRIRQFDISNENCFKDKVWTLFLNSGFQSPISLLGQELQLSRIIQ